MYERRDSPRKSEELGAKPEATAARCPKCSGCLSSVGAGTLCVSPATDMVWEVSGEECRGRGARMLSMVKRDVDTLGGL